MLISNFQSVTTMLSNFQPVTKQNSCPHCFKPDWCYRIGELSVCKRNAEPAPGWRITCKRDGEGTPFYAPVDKTKKPVRPKQKRSWVYFSRDGQPLVRVWREDDGNGGKPKRWQERWDGKKWVKGLKGIKREDIPIYRYSEVSNLMKLIAHGFGSMPCIEPQFCAINSV